MLSAMQQQLAGHAVVQGLPFTDVTYCKYGYGYKKITRIWHTLGDAFRPLPPCCRADPCPWYAEWKCHPCTAQRGPGKRKGQLMAGDRQTLDQLYSIPPLLCRDIANAALQANGRAPPEAEQEQGQAELRASSR